MATKCHELSSTSYPHGPTSVWKVTKYFNRNGKVLKVNYTHNGLLHLVMHFNGPFGLPVFIFFSFIKVNNAHFSFDLQLNKLKFSVGFELGSVDCEVRALTSRPKKEISNRWRIFSTRFCAFSQTQTFKPSLLIWFLHFWHFPKSISDYEPRT